MPNAAGFVSWGDAVVPLLPETAKPHPRLSDPHCGEDDVTLCGRGRS